MHSGERLPGSNMIPLGLIIPINQPHVHSVEREPQLYKANALHIPRPLALLASTRANTPTRNESWERRKRMTDIEQPVSSAPTLEPQQPHCRLSQFRTSIFLSNSNNSITPRNFPFPLIPYAYLAPTKSYYKAPVSLPHSRLPHGR